MVSHSNDIVVMLLMVASIVVSVVVIEDGVSEVFGRMDHSSAHSETIRRYSPITRYSIFGGSVVYHSSSH